MPDGKCVSSISKPLQKLMQNKQDVCGPSVRYFGINYIKYYGKRESVALFSFFLNHDANSILKEVSDAGHSATVQFGHIHFKFYRL